VSDSQQQRQRREGMVGALTIGVDYFCYCEVGFTERVIGDHIVTMVSVRCLRTSSTGSSLRLLD
jgi:hypothetical protein